jgi:CubicO group peptidase (beta-lactamase class C family)
MIVFRSTLRILALIAAIGYVVSAQQAPAPAASAAPAAVGVSADRLDRLHRGMQDLVDRREAGGIVTLIARDGKIVDVHASGFQDIESRTAMRTDTLFRIASMTKPITSVAVMMLYEEGKLLLTDPVAKFLPAFKSSRVLDAGAEAPVAARRGINLRDLLSHRSGLTYGFLNGGAVGNGYRKDGVTDGLTTTTMTLAEAIDKLAAEPLVSQPGAAWNYSLSTDVLGRVVEVVSGQPFNVFLRERVFKPLRMAETDFVVPAARMSRLATVYSPDGAGGIRPMKDPETFGNTVMSPVDSYRETKTYFSGGAGLVSTARDYARFAQMLSNGGTLDGTRLLSPKTIDLMTMSHTTDLPPSGLVGAGAQFGLGFRVVTDPAATQTLGSPGLYGWSGIYGTVFWVDPKERLVAIMMVQRYPGSPVAAAFQPLVYQALIK